MHILIQSLNFCPELIGVGKYSGEMAEYLAGAGHQVDVVTSYPYYPSWRVEEGYSPHRYSNEHICGARTTRCPVWVPSRPSGSKRLLHLASYSASSAPAVVRASLRRPRVMLCVAPALLASVAPLAAARYAGALSWLHVQDLELDTAARLRLLPPWVAPAGELLERRLLRSFDVVSTISRSMAERLAEKGVSPGAAVHLPNWVDTNEIRPLNRPSVLREGLGLTPDTVVVLYAGNLGAKQGLHGLLDSAALLLGREDVAFVIAGDGSERHTLVRRTRTESLSNVRFLPLQPSELLNELLNLADLHVVLERPGIESLVMPSKLTGALASGRPIVAASPPGGEIDRTLRASGAGVRVASADPVRLADELAALANAPDTRRSMGERGRRYAVRTLERARVLDRFEGELRRRVAGR